MFAADLIIALLIMVGLSGLAFFAGSRLRSGSIGLFVAAAFVAATIGIFFHGHLSWAKIMPHSSAVLLSNPLPILIAFLAGFARHVAAIRRSARPFAAATFSILAGACLVSPLIRPAFAPPQVAALAETDGFLVLQTHDATCAPASAASLLRFHGIETSEADMTDACLTSEFGTEALGLYRGLAVGCQSSRFSAQLASHDPDRWASTGQLPNVALVRFADDEYAQGVDLKTLKSKVSEPHWYTGSRSTEDGHAVMIVGPANCKNGDGGKWRVADPAVGIVLWSDEELRRRFTGEAIFLSRR